MVRRQVEEYESSDGTRGNTMGGKPVVILTTVGAKTARVHKTPVMRVESDGHYAVVASMGGAPSHPQWYYNLVANPLVELQDGPIKQVFRAHEASGSERARWWDLAVRAWPAYADYQLKTTRVIPVLVLEPAMS
jgi:deazaflavin-dependent oxidoreductase (nitroreductase family)